MSGRQTDSGVDVEGFTGTPPASDLLLSPQIRPASSGDTVPRPAELRWGKMLVAAAARLDLTPLRSTAYYLLEAYAPKQESGTLKLRVADSTGKALVTTAPSEVQVPAGGGVLKGQLDLSGLPPGHYDMVASLELAGKTVERSAGFTMAALDETLEKDVARREAAKVTDDGYFEAMNEAQLETAKEPLLLIAQSGELSKWSKDLSLRAKRKFLTEFWQKRDPSAGTPVNETRVAFYDAVAFAEKNYGEKGRAAVPGWKTDRGRIYVRNGAPEETLDRVQAGTVATVSGVALPDGQGPLVHLRGSVERARHLSAGELERREGSHDSQLARDPARGSRGRHRAVARDRFLRCDSRIPVSSFFPSPLKRGAKYESL